MEVWFIPLLVALGVLLAESRRFITSFSGRNAVNVSADAERVTAGASEMTAHVMLIEQLTKRMEVVEGQAARVPELEAQMKIYMAENEVFRYYIRKLREILFTNGIEVPELVWPTIDDIGRVGDVGAEGVSA